MRETERRIKKYEPKLPHVREKIFASLALFVFSIVILSVATFSWITLSVAPQAEGITTTVAANGNLEIALANADGTEPGATAIGDGAIAELFRRNTTWGNLINLNDTAYGLDKITLRPATLNQSVQYSILERPFRAADYKEDGRADKNTTDEFRFTVYDTQKDIFIEMINDGSAKSNYSAVKAVSYGQATPVTYDDPLLEKLRALSEPLEGLVGQSGTSFHNIATKQKLTPVTGLLGSYLNSRINDTFANEICQNSDVVGFYTLAKEFYDGPMTECGKTYMRIFELYQLKTYGLKDDGVTPNYTPYTDINLFCQNALSDLQTMNYPADTYFPALKTFIDDWQKMTGWLDAAAEKGNENKGGLVYIYTQAQNNGQVTWGEIFPYVNGMVHIDSARLNDKELKTLTAGDMAGMVFGTKNAVIYAGIIYNMDARVRSSSGGISVRDLPVAVNAPIVGNTTVKVNVSTNAPTAYPKATMVSDLALVVQTVEAKVETKDFKALDTYGYAIDFWVRTNAKNSYLLLDGKVEMGEKTKTIQIGSEEYVVYLANVDTVTAEVQEADGVQKETEVDRVTEENVSIYQKDGVWYRVEDSSEVEISDDLVDETTGNIIGREYTEVTKTVEDKEAIVTGYTGSNRVWNQSTDEDMMSRYSTSQGSGSCYVFYPNDPNEETQSLEILSALRVVFIDEEAKPIATASLDIEKRFSENGKVTIPLVLNSNSVETGILDDDGNMIYAITALEQNRPTFLCALVYLDGDSIYNQHALESTVIQGKFNIQFGSTSELNALEDEELRNQTREVDAILGTGSGQKEIAFEGLKNEDRTVPVRVVLGGAKASTVTANFVRQINANQGTRQETMRFTSSDGGTTWTASTSFPYSGVYVLSEIHVDGDSFVLESPCTVTVAGFTVNTVTLDNRENYSYRTADNSVSEHITVTMSAGPDNDLPEKVKAVFEGDNGITVITELEQDLISKEKWTGEIQFGASGVYRMNSLILENEIVDEQTGKYVDSRYFEIGATYIRTVYLGLRVNVAIRVLDLDRFNDEEFLDERKDVWTSSGIAYFFMQEHKFDVSLTITDENDEVVPGLTDVTLYYKGGDGLDADLKWHTVERRYVGSLTETYENAVEEFVVSRSGIYQFDKVRVGNEEIKVASYAPTITVYSRASMALENVIPAEKHEVVALNEGDTTDAISLSFKEAATAKVYGLWKKTDGSGTETYYITRAEQGSIGEGQNSYKFSIPREDGKWFLSAVKMSSVNFDDDPDDDVMGTFYTGTALDTLFEVGEGEPAKTKILVTNMATWNDVDGYFNLGDAYSNWNVQGNTWIDPEETGFFEVKVVASVATATLTYYDETGKEITDSRITYSNAFMEKKSLPTMVVKILDYEGKPINGVEGVVIKINHQMNDKVGYTFSNDQVPGRNYELKPTDNQNGTFTFTPSNIDDHKIWFDGEYKVTFGCSLMEANAKTIEIETKMPTVAISQISPTGEITADTTGESGSGHTTVNVPTPSATEATVYFKCETSSGCTGTTHSYTRPTVTITLSDCGNASGATLSFPSGSHVYDGSTKTSSFTWIGSGDCLRNIGYSSSSTRKTPAGEITATSLDMTYGNAVYSIPVSVTINNPY